MRAAAVFGVVSVLLISTPASAQSQDSLARLHFDAGSSYYAQGRYEDAIREFQEAFRLASEATKPLMLFNLAQAQERAGRLQDAADSLRRYAESGAAGNEREVVEERLRNLSQRLQSTSIALSVSEVGARVFVDDVERGTSPLAEPIRVPPGGHEVRVELEGFEPFTMRVFVDQGQAIRTEARLVARLAQREVTPPSSPPPASPPPPRTEPAPRGRLYTWVAAAVAGAAAAGGAALGFVALGHRDDANDVAQAGGDRGAWRASKSDAETMALLSDLSFGLAIAAAGAAVVLFFVEVNGEEAGPPAAVGLTLLPGGASVALRGEL